MGLSYHSGPPTLEVSLDSVEDIKRLKVTTKPDEFYAFQKEACKLLRSSMPSNKTLLGFVGSPFTLYSYAVEGAHKGNLTSSKLGLLMVGMIILLNYFLKTFWEKCSFRPKEEPTPYVYLIQLAGK